MRTPNLDPFEDRLLALLEDREVQLAEAQFQLRTQLLIVADKEQERQEQFIRANAAESQLRAATLVVAQVRALPEQWTATADAASGTADPRLWARAFGMRDCIEQLKWVLSPVPPTCPLCGTEGCSLCSPSVPPERTP